MRATFIAQQLLGEPVTLLLLQDCLANLNSRFTKEGSLAANWKASRQKEVKSDDTREVTRLSTLHLPAHGPKISEVVKKLEDCKF